MIPQLTRADIARVMRAARKWAGLSQQETARLLHVSQSFLSKIESGIAEPSAIQWVILCRTLGISADTLGLEKLEKEAFATPPPNLGFLKKSGKSTGRKKKSPKKAKRH